MALELDEMFEIVGSFKVFQIKLILILGWAGFWTSMHPLVSTFTAGDPGWRCITGSTICTYNGTFQASNAEMYPKRCEMNMTYGVDWEFDDAFTSIITKWNLSCDRSILASLSTSLYFAGFLVGVSGFGFLSDKFGRKLGIVISGVAASLFGTISAFSPNLTFFSACKFFIGITAGGGLVTFVFLNETCGAKHRGTSSNSIWYFFVAANVVLSGLAYGIREWEYLTLAISVPGFSIIIVWWFIPESPRWYLVNGKMEEAEKVMREVARVNKMEYPPDNIKPIQTEGREVKTGNILDLFRDKMKLKTTLVQWAAWFVNALAYYGVSLSAGNLGGSIYVNFLLLNLMELFGTWLTAWSTNKFGRKIPSIVGLIMAALTAMAAAAFPFDEDNDGYTAGRIIFALLAKLAIVVSFNAMYIFSAELMPTSVRNVGMASCSAVARFGSFSTSYILWLQNVHVTLPFGIMAVTALVAGLLCITLPETRNLPTQEVAGPTDTQVAPADPGTELAIVYDSKL